MIYLDNAATSYQKPECVIEAVCDAMRHSGNAGRGSHELSLSTSFHIYQARKKLSEIFGMDSPEQVVFTMNATMGLNMAIKGLLKGSGHVITTVLEHNSVLRPLYELEQCNTKLSFLGADEKGDLLLEQLEGLIREDTKAIVCTHASNVTGNVVDIERIGQIARRHGLFLLVDASQSAGSLPIDCEKMGIDVLAVTGHKGLMGPQGTGFLGIRKGVSIEPLLSGGTGTHSFDKKQPSELPEALESGTLNAHGIAGLLEAVKFLERIGLSTVYQKETSLMMQFYKEVRKLDKVEIYGNFSPEKGIRMPIVSLNIKGLDSSQISDELSCRYGILTRPGAHCAPLMHRHFHTERQGMVRFSFGYFNTEEEVQVAVNALRELCEEK